MSVTKKIAYIYILTAAALWGTMGIFVNQLTGLGFSLMQIVFFRAVVAVAGMAVLIFIKDKALFKIRLKDLWIVFGMGVISFVFFNICYFYAMQLTTLSVAAVLLYTAPIFVMLFSALLFGEKLTWKKALAIFLTFAGCVLVSGLTDEKVSFTAVSIMIGLGAGLGYALYSIFGRYGVDRNYPSLTLTFYTFLFAAVASACFIPVGKTFALGLAHPGWVLLTGVITCVIPYIVYTAGLAHVPSSTASIMATIEPVVATCISVFVYGEGMTLLKGIGIILVLSSIILIQQKTGTA